MSHLNIASAKNFSLRGASATKWCNADNFPRRESRLACYQ
ncbi:hypothetical protein [Herbaspirillum sp.]